MVRLWALGVAAVVLFAAAPLLRPLRSPAGASDRERVLIASARAVGERGTLAIDPSVARTLRGVVRIDRDEMAGTPERKTGVNLDRAATGAAVQRPAGSTGASSTEAGASRDPTPSDAPADIAAGPGGPRGVEKPNAQAPRLSTDRARSDTDGARLNAAVDQSPFNSQAAGQHPSPPPPAVWVTADAPAYPIALGGIVWLLGRVGLTFAREPDQTLYALTLVGATLPVALAAALVYRMGRAFELKRPWRAGLALGCVFATGWFASAVVLNPRAPAAAGVVLACGLVLHVQRSRRPRYAVAWLMPAGLCVAGAGVLDPAALPFWLIVPAGTVALRIGWRERLIGLGLLLAGAAGPIALHATINTRISGGLIPAGWRGGPGPLAGRAVGRGAVEGPLGGAPAGGWAWRDGVVRDATPADRSGRDGGARPDGGARRDGEARGDRRARGFDASDPAARDGARDGMTGDTRVSGRASQDGVSPDRASPDGADRGGASQDGASPDRASPDGADRGGASPDRASPDGADRGGASSGQADYFGESPVGPGAWGVAGRFVRGVIVALAGSDGLFTRSPAVLLGLAGVGVVLRRHWAWVLKIIAGGSIAGLAGLLVLRAVGPDAAGPDAAGMGMAVPGAVGPAAGDVGAVGVGFPGLVGPGGGGAALDGRAFDGGASGGGASGRGASGGGGAGGLGVGGWAYEGSFLSLGGLFWGGVYLPLVFFFAGAWARRPHRAWVWGVAGGVVALSTAMTVLAAVDTRPPGPDDSGVVRRFDRPTHARLQPGRAVRTSHAARAALPARAALLAR